MSSFVLRTCCYKPPITEARRGDTAADIHAPPNQPRCAPGCRSCMATVSSRAEFRSVDVEKRSYGCDRLEDALFEAESPAAAAASVSAAARRRRLLPVDSANDSSEKTLRTVRTISSSENLLTSGQMVGRHAATTDTPISTMDQ